MMEEEGAMIMKIDKVKRFATMVRKPLMIRIN
jgi:hypothetical protein